jgi:predicted TIM-barrel fold metal-dependent hydrolase
MSIDAPIPIVDAHHHFWDPVRNPHPWLRDEPPIPFRYGDYTAIRIPFLPDDYRRLRGHHNVVASVTMEGEWDETDPVAETAWMSRLAADHGTPIAHVARAFLHLDTAPEIIAAHAAYPLVRAIRHKPATAARPDLVEPGMPAAMGDPAWRRGYRHLANYSLHFELQAPWWHAHELMDLIAAHPETPVVINHAFLPADRSPAAMSGWRKALKLAATAPQTSLKISGIGIKGRPWTFSDQRPVIDTCIDTFGADRCLFASNFPVDGLCGEFTTIYDGFMKATSDLTRADRLKMFHDNAIRIYQLPLRPLAKG